MKLTQCVDHNIQYNHKGDDADNGFDGVWGKQVVKHRIDFGLQKSRYANRVVKKIDKTPGFIAK